MASDESELEPADLFALRRAARSRRLAGLEQRLRLAGLVLVVATRVSRLFVAEFVLHIRQGFQQLAIVVGPHQVEVG